MAKKPIDLSSRFVFPTEYLKNLEDQMQTAKEIDSTDQNESDAREPELEAERIRLENLLNNIQGAPPKEVMLSYEEHHLIQSKRNKEFIDKIFSNPYKEDPESGLNKIDEFSHLRLEALKSAIEIVKNINHFEHKYDSISSLLKDVDLVHEIADYNFKYIIGEK